MLSDNFSIQLIDISKLFKKQNQKTFKEFLPAIFTGNATADHFWALKNVNLDINKGESIGIIGPNGSGKSTILKLIAGVSSPTTGEIKIQGKIAPLIELGAGFHPELSGRENVYLNGVILGMTKQEIRNKFDDIVNFAEIWDFIDQPVKHYSSGMYLRLAFSVAIHTDPDIFLVDEILAVGDHQFQRKCLTKIEEMKKKNITFIIVSHSPDLLKEHTNKTVVLEKGQIKYFDDSEVAVGKYLSDL